MQQLTLPTTKKANQFMKIVVKKFKLCHQNRKVQSYKKSLTEILQQKRKDLNVQYKHSEEQTQIYSLLKYFCNKLGLNKISDKEQHYVQQKVFISHSNFSQYSNLNCYGCKQIFVRGFLRLQMDHFQLQTLKPYIYLTIKQIAYKEIRNTICAAANSQTGSGTIIFVNTIQNNYATGISQFTINQRKLFKQNIVKSLKSIIDSQSINVNVTSLTLSNYIKQHKQKQFVIKMDVITQSYSNINKKYKKFYYIYGQKKGQSHQLVKDEVNKKFVMKEIKMEKFYQQIQIKNKRFMVKYPIKQKCQLFQPNGNLKFNVKLLLQPIWNYIQIPKIHKYQEVFLLEIIDKPKPGFICQFEKQLKLKRGKFKKYKLNLFQNELPLLQIHKYPTTSTLNKQFYCIFQINQRIKQIINYYRKLFVKIVPIKKILLLGRKLLKQEYDYYNQIIFEKYNIQPLIRKSNSQSNIQQYNNIKITFDEQDKDASLYSYLFFVFINKCPMFQKS